MKTESPELTGERHVDGKEYPRPSSATAEGIHVVLHACLRAYLEEVSVCDSQQAGQVGVGRGGLLWGCHGVVVGVMDGEVGPEVCAVGQRADEGYQGRHCC